MGGCGASARCDAIGVAFRDAFALERRTQGTLFPVLLDGSGCFPTIQLLVCGRHDEFVDDSCKLTQPVVRECPGHGACFLLLSLVSAGRGGPRGLPRGVLREHPKMCVPPFRWSVTAPRACQVVARRERVTKVVTTAAVPCARVPLVFPRMRTLCTQRPVFSDAGWLLLSHY